MSSVQARRASGVSTRRPLRVAFIDDNETLRRSIIRVLPAFEWIEASNRVEGLTRVLAQPHPDRLLIDVQLGPPGNTDGLTLVKEIRDRGLRMPAIILSGHLTFARTIYALEQQALAFPKDGLDAEALREILENPFAAASAIDSVTFEELARSIRTLASPLSESLRELRRVAMEQELKSSGGNVTATARATGYTRAHVARFRKTSR